MNVFSDEFLAYLELKEDLLFGKIPMKKFPYYIKESLQFGREMGISLKGKTIQELYQASGIALDYVAGGGEFFKVKLRAQFEHDKNGSHKVILYKESIQELATTCKISEEEAKNIHLAHEYFHYLEMNDTLVSDQLDEVELFSLLKYTRKGRIARTSEIAAHSFAKEFLGLKFLPNYYDYLYLLEQGEITQEEIEEMHRGYSSFNI